MFSTAASSSRPNSSLYFSGHSNHSSTDDEIPSADAAQSSSSIINCYSKDKDLALNPSACNSDLVPDLADQVQFQGKLVDFLIEKFEEDKNKYATSLENKEKIISEKEEVIEELRQLIKKISNEHRTLRVENSSNFGLKEALFYCELGIYKSILFFFSCSLVSSQISPIEHAHWPEQKMSLDEFSANLISFAATVRALHVLVNCLNGSPLISVKPPYPELRGHRIFTFAFIAFSCLADSMKLGTTKDGRVREKFEDLIMLALTLRTTYVLLSCMKGSMQLLGKELKDLKVNRYIKSA